MRAGRSRGFSLFELMVAVLILALIIYFCCVQVIQNRDACTKATQLELVQEYALNLIDEVAASPYLISELPKTETFVNVTIGTKYYDVERKTYVKETGTQYNKLMIEVVAAGKEKKEKVSFSKMIVAR